MNEKMNKWASSFMPFLPIALVQPCSSFSSFQSDDVLKTSSFLLSSAACKARVKVGLDSSVACTPFNEDVAFLFKAKIRFLLSAVMFRTKMKRGLNVPNLFKPHNYTQLRYGQYQKIPSEITAVLADREVLRIYIVKENLTHFSASSQDKKVL